MREQGKTQKCENRKMQKVKYSKSEKESSEKKGKLDTLLDDDFDVDDDIKELKPIDLSHKDAE